MRACKMDAPEYSGEVSQIFNYIEILVGASGGRISRRDVARKG